MWLDRWKHLLFASFEWSFEVCWGNYPGPHHHDVALADIAEIIVAAAPKFISVEACNPGHAHEHEVWKQVKLPADKVLMPGVLDTTTSHIENPRLVAQRLEAYMEHVGMARVMACRLPKALKPYYIYILILLELERPFHGFRSDLKGAAIGPKSSRLHLIIAKW